MTRQNTPHPTITVQQKRQVILETRRRIEDAGRRLNVPLKKVGIRFDVAGASWGYFVRKGEQRWIRYNPALFSRHFAEGLADTVPHEVAHYIVDCWYPLKRCKPHGPEWRAVMAVFGIQNPRATHSTDLSGIPLRRQRRFRYACACGSVALSATRHNRCRYKGVQYFCRRCGQPLVFVP